MTTIAPTTSLTAPATLTEPVAESILTLRVNSEQFRELTVTDAGDIRAVLQQPGLGAAPTLSVPSASGSAPARIVLEGDTAGGSYERVWAKDTESAGEAGYTLVVDTASTGYIS
jgi:hypothetical protein